MSWTSLIFLGNGEIARIGTAPSVWLVAEHAELLLKGADGIVLQPGMSGDPRVLTSGSTIASRQ